MAQEAQDALADLLRDICAALDPEHPERVVIGPVDFGASRGVGASKECSDPTSQPPTSVSGHDLSRSTDANPSQGVGPAS